MLILDVIFNRIWVIEYIDRKINYWMNLRIEEWVFVIKNIKKRKENEIV